MPNVIPHDLTKDKRRALYKIPFSGKKMLSAIVDFYNNEKKHPLKKLSLSNILEHPPQVTLENYISRTGNISPYELLCISSVVREAKPKRLLEIGTFDGNTTLQMAINSPDEAIIQTIDLPPGTVETKEPVLSADIQFIVDEKKLVRKFEGTPYASKIQQHLGDSTDYDFSLFSKEGLLDLVFIDGGHTYECVKSDTENVLPHLKEGGIVFWHDYTPFFPGVYRYLNEVDLPLSHIEGTTLVMAKI